MRPQIWDIEAVRRKWDLQHEELFMHLMSHPWITRRVLRHGYDALTTNQPSRGHADALAILLLQRLSLSTLPSLLGVTSRESQHTAVSKLLGRYATLEDFADAVAREEQTHSYLPAAPGFDEPAQRISAILMADKPHA